MENEKHPGGRPLLFDTPEKLLEAISAYFDKAPRPTLAGLAVALKIDRQTLYNYKARDKYFDMIKSATDRVEAIYEERLIYENQPTGVIFALKNMGWRDKTETGFTDNEGNDVKPQIVFTPATGCQPIKDDPDNPSTE